MTDSPDDDRGMANFLKGPDFLVYSVLLTMIPEDQWADFPEPVVKALAEGADWQFSHKAKVRRAGASWYPTWNPEAARRTGHYVNAIAHARLPDFEGKPYACILRHESDAMLDLLLLCIKRRALKEWSLREHGD